MPPIVLGALMLYVLPVALGIYLMLRLTWYSAGTMVRVDDEAVTVRMHGKVSTIPWGAIFSFTQDKRAPGKFSSAQERNKWLSLRGAEGQVLAQWNRAWTPSSALKNGIAEQIEGRIHEVLCEMGREAPPLTPLQRWQAAHPVSTWGHTISVRVSEENRILGGICAVFFLGIIVAMVLSPPKGTAVGAFYGMMSCFFLMSLFVMALVQTLSADEEKIELRIWKRIDRILWAEVEQVEWQKLSGSFVFRGRGKILVIPTSRHWDKNRAQMELFIRAQCEKLEFPIREPEGGLWITSKNTKVR